jgi:hypothetical protein
MGALGRPIQPKQPPPPVRPVWLENEFAIYAIAQSSIGWLADRPHDLFAHGQDETYVTAWPISCA